MSASGKRRLPAEWKESDCVRRALYDTVDALRQLNAVVALRGADDAALEINAALVDDARAQMAALDTAFGTAFTPVTLPALPADCWRNVMEFVLERRTMATFGAGGVVNEPWMWRPVANIARTIMLRSLRLVSRSWSRVASDLVLFVSGWPGKERHLLLRDVCRNVRYIDGVATNCTHPPEASCSCNDCERRRANDRATMIAGGPHPDGYSRINQPSSFSRMSNGTQYRIDLQDRVCKLVSTPQAFIHALKTADIVYYSTALSPVDVEPFIPRTRIIYVHPYVNLSNGISDASTSLMKTLEKFPPEARQHMHISLPAQKYKAMASIARQLAPATIYLPTGTSPARQARLRREFSNVQFVPRYAFDPTDCVAGPP